MAMSPPLMGGSTTFVVKDVPPFFEEVATIFSVRENGPVNETSDKDVLLMLPFENEFEVKDEFIANMLLLLEPAVEKTTLPPVCPWILAESCPGRVAIEVFDNRSVSVPFPERLKFSEGSRASPTAGFVVIFRESFPNLPL
jgi:hypothetical protein